MAKVVPNQPDAFGVRPGMPDRQVVDRQLPIGVHVLLGRQTLAGLVIVDLESPVLAQSQAVDEAFYKVKNPPASSGNPILFFHLDGPVLVERGMRLEIGLQAGAPDFPVVLRAGLLVPDDDVFAPVLVPVALESLKRLLQRRRPSRRRFS